MKKMYLSVISIMCLGALYVRAQQVDRPGSYCGAIRFDGTAAVVDSGLAQFLGIDYLYNTAKNCNCDATGAPYGPLVRISNGADKYSCIYQQNADTMSSWFKDNAALNFVPQAGDSPEDYAACVAKYPSRVGIAFCQKVSECATKYQESFGWCYASSKCQVDGCGDSHGMCPVWREFWKHTKEDSVKRHIGAYAPYEADLIQETDDSDNCQLCVKTTWDSDQLTKKYECLKFNN